MLRRRRRRRRRRPSVELPRPSLAFHAQVGSAAEAFDARHVVRLARASKLERLNKEKESLAGEKGFNASITLLMRNRIVLPEHVPEVVKVVPRHIIKKVEHKGWSLEGSIWQPRVPWCAYAPAPRVAIDFHRHGQSFAGSGLLLSPSDSL